MSKKGNFDGLCNRSCDLPKKGFLMAYISNSKVLLHLKFPFLETLSFLGITIKGNYNPKKFPKIHKKWKKNQCIPKTLKITN